MVYMHVVLFISLFILDFLQSNRIALAFIVLTTIIRFSLVDASMECSKLAVHGVLRHGRQVDMSVVMQKICGESRLLVSGFQRLTDQVLSCCITQCLSNLFCNMVHRTE